MAGANILMQGFLLALQKRIQGISLPNELLDWRSCRIHKSYVQVGGSTRLTYVDFELTNYMQIVDDIITRNG